MFNRKYVATVISSMLSLVRMSRWEFVIQSKEIKPLNVGYSVYTRIPCALTYMLELSKSVKHCRSLFPNDVDQLATNVIIP